MKDLGFLQYFHGIEIACSRHRISLSQLKYTLDLLQDTCMLGCKPAFTPMDPNLKLSVKSSDFLPVHLIICVSASSWSPNLFDQYKTKSDIWCECFESIIYCDILSHVQALAYFMLLLLNHEFHAIFMLIMHGVRQTVFDLLLASVLSLEIILFLGRVISVIL